MLEEKKLFYNIRRNLFDKLVNILFEFQFKRGSQRKVSENIRILSGRISGKLPGKPGDIREKISDDLVWTLTDEGNRKGKYKYIVWCNLIYKKNFSFWIKSL